MSTDRGGRQQLDAYLEALRRRIRSVVYARAAAAAGAGVLLLSVMLVWMLDRHGFSAWLTTAGRIGLLLIVAIAAVAMVWRPLRKLAQREGADEIERRVPVQAGRIDTYLDARRRETTGVESVLTDLLAGDALRIAQAAPVNNVVPLSRVVGASAFAAIAFVVLALLLTMAPAYWGYGARHLLLGFTLPQVAIPVRAITVSPGDVTVRRNSDLAIRASLQGFNPDQAQVLVRFDDEQQWQQAPMQAVAGSNNAAWEFKLFALRGSLHYYVSAENSQSAQHTVTVADLPRIERVRVTYDYPDWTGLPSKSDESTRDIRAVAGTDVQLEVLANTALQSPAIVLEGEGGTIPLQGAENTGRITLKRPGSYHIAARVANEVVPLTDDYSIEIVADEKPTITIQKPGRDWRASNIEEVPVRIQAQDDFRLRDVQLRYSVNGGEWQTRELASGSRQANPESLLRLEELGALQAQGGAQKSSQLVPGDLVAYYAVARDRQTAVQTDLFMVQVQPFERRFLQGQGGDGSGNGRGDEQGAISERQREILLATWNLQRSNDKGARSRTQLEDSAKMLAELQTTLAQQARNLAERTRARGSVDRDERVRTFVESLDKAAAVMDPAAGHLNAFELPQAVPVEQQALQQLLRAESAFRDVQVSMQGSSSRGGGQEAAHNFTEMFELEMDVDKNHYETESQLAREARHEELDEAVRRLKELAERQEKLAQQARRQSLPQQDQRWRQEQLRREVEDLRRRLAEMQRSQTSQGSSSSTAQDAASGRDQSGEQVANAVNALRHAVEEMRAANDADREAPEAAREQSASQAGRNLRRALQQIDQPRNAAAADDIEQLASLTEKLAQRQRAAEANLYDSINEAMAVGRRRGQIDANRADELAQEREAMADDVGTLQQRLRDAIRENRSKRPATSQQLGEVVNDLENANVAARLSRSAQEIQYGRSREAASRDGIITEALEKTQRDLGAAAQAAAKDSAKGDEAVTADALLAQIGELRRALQESRPDPQGRSTNRSASEQSAENSSQTASNNLTPGAYRPDRFGNTALENGAIRFREAEQASERVRELANRLNAGPLNKAEIAALQRMAHELRSLAGNPMASQAAAMARLVDQIELATLAAAEKSREGAPAHTSAVISDTPQYRAAVAEYYRRLGGN
ncbi:MAG TPA: hypothetical protein VGN07_13735 [Steroidobacteraceae bacterium]